MRLHQTLILITRALILGLAIAFIVVLVWPKLISRHRIVEIRVAPVTHARTPAPLSYASAVKKAAAAVVNINTAKVVLMPPAQLGHKPFFEQFFGRRAQPGRRRIETSLGSGVIVSPSGFILTNYHVIKGADAIRVFLKDGRSAPATVVGVDPSTDLAVLKITLPHLHAIIFGHTRDTKVGDVVLAIGDPFGIGQTVTMGIVSATGRDELGLSAIENFIQTDAAINPGNSGGALINTNGHLVGINTALYTRSGGFEGIGFAIPANLARHVVRQIIRYGHVIEGWIGVAGQTLTPALATALHLPATTRGVLIAAVYAGSPAAAAGLHRGDIITAINGRPLRDANNALLTITDTRPGVTLRLAVLHHHHPQICDVVVGVRPPNSPTTIAG